MYQELGPPRTLYEELDGRRRRFLDSMLDGLLDVLDRSGECPGMGRHEMRTNAIVLFDSGHLKLVKYHDGRLGWAMWKAGRYLRV